jgi:hypothetical protein
MKCRYCDCAAIQEPGAKRCPKCHHDAAAHNGSVSARGGNAGRAWLIAVTIVGLILFTVYYSNRQDSPEGGSRSLPRPMESPVPQVSNEPLNASPSHPMGPDGARFQPEPQYTPPQPPSPPLALPVPQPSGAPNPPPLNPSGHPLGIFCPPDTIAIGGECVPNRTLPPGLPAPR